MSDPSTVAFLETVSLCRGMSPEQLEGLSRLLQPVRLSARQVLFREGDPGDSFYFVRAGEIGVYKRIPGAGQERLAALKAGAPLGHLCLMDGERRSATCVAHADSIVLRGEKRLFDRLFSQGDALAFRFIDNIARELCESLRQVNQRMADLYEHPEVTAQRLKDVARQLAASLERETEQARVVQLPQERGGVRKMLASLFR